LRRNRRQLEKETNMRMQPLYYEFDAEDEKVYVAWLRKVSTLLMFILIVAVTIGSILALDALTTPEQRIAPLQQSGAFL
jgi:hypothetical protein